MATRPVTLLLVEDNAEDVRLIQEALAQQRHVAVTLETVSRLADAAPRLRQGGIDLVLLDLTLPDSKGLETLLRLKVQAGDTPLVILTASDDDALAVKALQQGAQDYLVKGFLQVYPDMLGRAISYAIERHRAEEAAASASAETQQLLSSITSILIGVSPSGLVTHWNAVAEATFGVPASQARGRPLAECRVRWDTVRILEGLADCSTSGRPSRVDDVTFTRLDGREGCLGVTIIPVRGTSRQVSGFLLFGADVTDRKEAETERARLQEQLAQAQKMETIGRFAGGIAHDFNNFLQVILGFAWLIRAKQRDDRELISDLQEIVHAAESASAMVRQLLAFSRQQPLQPEVFEINGAVRGMARLLEQFVGEHIRLELALAEEPLAVKLDRAGLEQILMNLCANARDAMQERGTLTVRTARVAPRGPVRAGGAPLEGEYARLSVRDSGPGMDPKVAAHIFEPFFTTKQVGKGTGLGLAVVYGLVQQHGGTVDIETALGHGTTFHLYFPLQALPASTRAPAAGPSRRVETILVIEHDDRQRALAEEVLRETGYRVLAAGDGTQALRLHAEHAGAIDAVLLDVSLPDLPSQEVLTRLRQARPPVRILLVSSYLDRQLRAMESSLGTGPSLQKPYVPAQLLDQVRHLLSQPAPAGGDGAGRRRVLVVDDEPAVLVFCARALTAHHDVTTVPSGPAAVEALRRGAFDVLLTDVRMPQMDGLALIDQAVKIQPGLKVLAMSGSLTGDMEQRLCAAGVCRQVIRKPFSGEQLHAAIVACG